MINRKGLIAFIAPALLLVLAIDVIPAIWGLGLSFFKIRYFTGGQFVGFGNYLYALQDPQFFHSLRVTLVFSFSAVALCFSIALPMALLFERLGKLGVILVAITLIPWIMSRVVVALLWRWMADPSDAGLLNYFLSFLGLGPYPFLTETTGAMIGLVLVAVWRTLGFALILLFAGLKNIPAQLYRAAKVDGATVWYRFRTITLPLLKHPIMVVLSLLTLSFFNEISLVIGLTGGGPINATTTFSYLVYKHARVNFNTGYANALATILFVISIGLVSVYYRLLRAQEAV